MARLILGTESSFVRDIEDVLEVAKRNVQDFVLVPLFHPRNRRGLRSGDRAGPATRSDMVLESAEWISNVVGKISEDIDLDNPCRRIQRDAEEIMRAEFQWACHLGLQAIVVPPPTIFCPNYARVLKQLCAKILGQQQVWVRVPLVMPLDFHSGEAATRRPSDGWYAWDALRHMCGHDRHLFVALELTADLPEDLESCISRWTGEPVKTVVIPTRLFLTNKGGFPVLSFPYQRILKALFRFKLHVVVRGRCFHSPLKADGTPEPSESGRLTLYLQYIRYLHTQAKNELSTQEAWNQAYNDYLQAPLQPLMDNLESQIYETFEKDPVKYERYEAAIVKALHAIDIKRQDSSVLQSSESLDGPAMSTDTVVITVVGAGRGPLVAAALAAGCVSNIPLRIYAVEKNPNAVITLRNRVKTEQWTNVTIVPCDMRFWRPPELAHIMVSELLGSWGDNELSPECLDGAQVCLRPDGISIPTSYTSYLSLVSAPRLWTCVQEMPDKKAIDTPYVVKFHNSFQVSEDIPLFRFQHPNYDKVIDNTRFEKVCFKALADATVHGFIGTFESVLFDDVMISIVPKTFSEGMFSWFPLFIPLANPIRVVEGQLVDAHVWRCSNEKIVWYEWCASSTFSDGSVKVTPVQNCNGKSFSIGL